MALHVVFRAYSFFCATADRDLQAVWQGIWLVLLAGPVLLLGQRTVLQHPHQLVALTVDYCPDPVPGPKGCR